MQPLPSPLLSPLKRKLAFMACSQSIVLAISRPRLCHCRRTECSGLRAVQSVDPLGGTGGVYYDFMKIGPMRLGADLRGSILTTKRGAYINFNGPGARIYSVLGGVRGVFQPTKSLKPYLQISAGLGRSDYGLYVGRPVSNQPLPNQIFSNFQYEGLAGLDIKLLPIMDWRVAEFGYGGLDPFGTYSHNYPIKQVSMGFVFHLP